MQRPCHIAIDGDGYSYVAELWRPKGKGLPPDLFDQFRELYGVPPEYVPIGAVAVGHPDPAADQGGSSRVIRRRTIEDLVHDGRWQRQD